MCCLYPTFMLTALTFLLLSVSYAFSFDTENYDFDLIFIPPHCQKQLSSTLENAKDDFETSEHLNRYGHPIITDFNLQQQLIADGIAITYPKSFRALDLIRDLYETEHLTRQTKQGCAWNLPHPITAQALNIPPYTTDLMIVMGTVVDIYNGKNFVYLNFDKDWKTDFTIRYRKKNKYFRDLDPNIFKGKTIRVRGLISYYNGPMITLDHPIFLEMTYEQ